MLFTAMLLHELEGFLKLKPHFREILLVVEGHGLAHELRRLLHVFGRSLHDIIPNDGERPGESIIISVLVGKDR